MNTLSRHLSRGRHRLPAMLLTLAALLLSGVSACDRLVLGDEPGSGYGELFDLVWEDVDRHYTYFDLKDVNWDSVRDATRPRALSATGDYELFQAISEMLGTLRDGHVNLYAGGNWTYRYDAWYKNYPVNFDPSDREAYLDRLVMRPAWFGRTPGDPIAYVRFDNFASGTDHAGTLTSLLRQHGPFRALIIDMRNNGGGSDMNSRLLAGLFAENTYTYAYYRYKRGPAHDDFTPWQPKRVRPSAEATFPIPLAVLTNRGCFSACEDFVLAVRPRADVTVLGDTTGGGAGNPVSRELPNGWTYRFSTWQQVSADMTHYEGRGIIPDIPIWISEEASAKEEDPILDRAIRLLRARIGG